MQTGGAKKRIGENNEKQKRHQDYYQYLECVGGILFYRSFSFILKKQKKNF